MEDYDEPNILFFAGIDPHKYDIDTIWTSRLLELTQEPAESAYDETLEPADSYAPIEFDRIPDHFESLDKWPKSTNLRCGACSRNFKSRPAAVVTNVINTGTEIATKLRTPVITCSFDCSVHFINVRYIADKRKWNEMHEMLRLLYRKMTGQVVTELNEAPDYLRMTYWGGDLSIDNFIKCLKHVLPEFAPTF